MKFINKPLLGENSDEEPMCCDHNIDCYGCMNGGCHYCFATNGGGEK